MNKKPKKEKPSWGDMVDDIIQPSGKKVAETLIPQHVEEKSKPLPHTEEEMATVYYDINESLRTRLRVHCARIGQPMSYFITEAIEEMLDRKENTVQRSVEEGAQTSRERKVPVHYRISKSLRTRLRVHCAGTGQPMRNFVIEAITESLERKEKGAPSA